MEGLFEIGFILGIILVGAMLFIHARRTSALIQYMRNVQPGIWKALGGPIGFSPTDPRYSGVLWKWITEKQYQKSNDPELIRLGASVHKSGLISVTTFCIFILGMLTASYTT
jgi:hypothetical protein